VVRGELHRDDHRGGQGGDLGQRAPSRDEGHEDREADREDLHRGLQPLERGVLSPDAERRGAIDLALDRPVVERRKPRVDGGQREHEPEHDDQAGAERRDRSKPSEQRPRWIAA